MVRVFEFDAAKSLTNKIKHGIDFIAAQKLWADENQVEFGARTEDETRLFVVGVLDKKYWTAVITYRSECIRIISVRRSRWKEVAIYESQRS